MVVSGPILTLNKAIGPPDDVLIYRFSGGRRKTIRCGEKGIHAEGALLHFFSLSCSGGRIGTRHFVRSWFHRRTVHCIRGMAHRGPRNARSSAVTAAFLFSDASLTSLCLLNAPFPPICPWGSPPSTVIAIYVPHQGLGILKTGVFWLRRSRGQKNRF